MVSVVVECKTFLQNAVVLKQKYTLKTCKISTISTNNWEPEAVTIIKTTSLCGRNVKRVEEQTEQKKT